MDAVGCDWLLSDLGPPPDAILRIPPPPLPHFIDRIYLHEMAAAAAGVADSDKENETALPCHWCHWARRLDAVGSISVTSGTGTLTAPISIQNILFMHHSFLDKNMYRNGPGRYMVFRHLGIVFNADARGSAFWIDLLET